jgi:hypothetical protein
MRGSIRLVPGTEVCIVIDKASRLRFPHDTADCGSACVAGAKAITVIVAEPTLQHALHTALVGLFALFTWCTGLSTPAVYHVGPRPARHCWCKSHVGVQIPSVVHGIFPKRRTSGGKKREVMVLHDFLSKRIAPL